MSAPAAPTSFRTPEWTARARNVCTATGKAHGGATWMLRRSWSTRRVGMRASRESTGLDQWEAASAAFDAMRTPAVRNAEDPWAVITRAVQVTLIAEESGNGLLCSTHQARRPQYSGFHDPGAVQRPGEPAHRLPRGVPAAPAVRS